MKEKRPSKGKSKADRSELSGDKEDSSTKSKRKRWLPGGPEEELEGEMQSKAMKNLRIPVKKISKSQMPGEWMREGNDSVDRVSPQKAEIGSLPAVKNLLTRMRKMRAIQASLTSSQSETREKAQATVEATEMQGRMKGPGTTRWMKALTKKWRFP